MGGAEAGGETERTDARCGGGTIGDRDTVIAPHTAVSSQGQAALTVGFVEAIDSSEIGTVETRVTVSAGAVARGYIAYALAGAVAGAGEPGGGVEEGTVGLLLVAVHAGRRVAQAHRVTELGAVASTAALTTAVVGATLEPITGALAEAEA